jgi:hypothetical protein
MFGCCVGQLYGMTALALAHKCRNMDVIRLLLAAGAKLNVCMLSLSYCASFLFLTQLSLNCVPSVIIRFNTLYYQ